MKRLFSTLGVLALSLAVTGCIIAPRPREGYYRAPPQAYYAPPPRPYYPPRPQPYYPPPPGVSVGVNIH